MSWTAAQQAGLKKEWEDLSVEFFGAANAWWGAIADAAREPDLSPEVGRKEAQLDSVIARMRLYSERVRDLVESQASGGLLDDLAALSSEIADEKRTLEKLRSEAVTREEQGDSLNPKVTASPYVNILGLNRTFRQSTWTTLLVVSIVFAALALGLIGYLVFRIVTLAPGEPLISAPGLSYG